MEKVITTQNTNKKEPSQLKLAIYSFINYLFKSIFVIFTLNKLNSVIRLAEMCYVSGLKKEKIPKEAVWFGQQIKRNTVTGLIPIILVLVGISFASYKISSNIFITKGFAKAYELVKQRQFKDAKNKLALAQSLSPTFNEDFKISAQALGFSILLAFLWGSNILQKHPLIKNSKNMKKSLIDAGLIKQDQEPLILFVPSFGEDRPGLGVFLEILNGNSPRHILENNALWSSIGDGIKIGEYVEHPTVRKYVFFKVLYSLKKGDEYGYSNYQSQKV